MTTVKFRNIGIGYRQGNNFFIKLSTPADFSNPIVTSANELKLLADGYITSEVNVYERQSQTLLDAGERGSWTVKRVGIITPARSDKTLKMSLRKLPDYYINRKKVIESMKTGGSVDVFDVVKE